MQPIDFTTSKGFRRFLKMPSTLTEELSTFTPFPRDTGNDSYYLRSFPGLTQSNIAKGISYAVEYNDVKHKEYRLIGSELYEDGVSVQGGLSPSISQYLPHSK